LNKFWSGKSQREKDENPRVRIQMTKGLNSNVNYPSGMWLEPYAINHPSVHQ
jgi:hypothetical protein